jgi:predicted acetyltransferase
MSPPEFRQPRADEIPDFFRVSLQGYGMDASDEEIAHEQLVNEVDRSFGALDDGRWVGSSGAFSFELTLPGGALVPASGITMVGVGPTHRRRGILTTMLRWLHDDAVRRGEPLAILTASEASNYPRFGYGVATEACRLRIPADVVAFDPPLVDSGSFATVDPHVGTGDFAAIYDRVRRSSPGWLRRRDGEWAQVRDDPPSGRDGRTPLRAVVHRDVLGAPDGYATWRIAMREGEDRVADNTLHIEELVAESADVEVALWQFLANIDLVTSLVWARGPAEPAIRWRLVEPRQLRTEQRFDLVWARLLDVAAVLAARTYGAAATLTFEVHDAFRPESAGTFRLHVSGRGETGTCERIAGADAASGPAPDLTLAMPDLSSIALGGIAPSTLAAAGRITPRSSDVLDLADALFTTPSPPYSPLEF